MVSTPKNAKKSQFSTKKIPQTINKPKSKLRSSTNHTIKFDSNLQTVRIRNKDTTYVIMYINNNLIFEFRNTNQSQAHLATNKPRKQVKRKSSEEEARNKAKLLEKLLRYKQEKIQKEKEKLENEEKERQKMMQKEKRESKYINDVYIKYIFQESKERDTCKVQIFYGDYNFREKLKEKLSKWEADKVQVKQQEKEKPKKKNERDSRPRQHSQGKRLYKSPQTSYFK